MNERNYRNKRFNNTRANQHNFNSKTNSMFARFIGYFKLRFRKQKVNKVTAAPKPIKRLFQKYRNRNYSPKHKMTNCAIKQYANMKKLHSDLWDGSIKVELV